MDQPFQVVVASAGPVARGQLGQITHDFQVAVDLVHHAGAADLHDDLMAAVGRGVCLTNGAGGNGCGIDMGQDFFRLGIRFGLDQRPDLVHGHRRGVVLEFVQFSLVARWQQIRARGHQLTQLDERGSEFFQRHAQVFGLGVEALGLEQPGASQRGAPFGLDPAHGKTETMPREHLDDLDEPFAARNHGEVTVPYKVRLR